MSGFRNQGPICSTTAPSNDSGTMCRNRTPSPGPLGHGANSLGLYAKRDKALSSAGGAHLMMAAHILSQMAMGATPTPALDHEAFKKAILDFLKKNPAIDKLNFKLKDLKVWPNGYRSDIYNALQSKDIRFHLMKRNAGGVAANYDPKFDVMNLAEDFDIANPSDQSYFIHECTHAYIDILNLGSVDIYNHEALAYTAQQLFLKASGQAPITGIHKFFDVAADVADNILKTQVYEVPQADVNKLIEALKKDPGIPNKPAFSNAFNRSALDWSLHKSDSF
jgi:hypothetical protein